MTETSPTMIAPSWRDYYEMCKPRVVLLMLLCTLVGMYLATPGWVELDLIAACLTGVALVAGSAAALNHLIDAKVDQRMARTENRPVAQGRVSFHQGLAFVALTGLAGEAVLYLFVNPLTAWLNFFLLGWLRIDLYALLKASHFSKYCDRGSFRCGTAPFWLDSGDQQCRRRWDPTCVDYFCMDPAPFLGAGSRSPGRI